MNWDELKVKNVTPLGFLSGGLDGVRIITKIETNNESFYTFLIPPFYEIKEKLDEYMVNSAMSKYGYQPFESKIIISSKEEFQKFLESAQKLNKQVDPKTF